MDLMQGNVLSFAERRNRVVRKALRRPANKKVNKLKRGARNRKRVSPKSSKVKSTFRHTSAKRSTNKRAPAKRSVNRKFSKRLRTAQKKRVGRFRSFIQRKAAKVHKHKKTLKKSSKKLVKKPAKKHLRNKVVKRVIKKANKLKQIKKSTPSNKNHKKTF